MMPSCVLQQGMHEELFAAGIDRSGRKGNFNSVFIEGGF